MARTGILALVDLTGEKKMTDNCILDKKGKWEEGKAEAMKGSSDQIYREWGRLGRLHRGGISIRTFCSRGRGNGALAKITCVQRTSGGKINVHLRNRMTAEGKYCVAKDTRKGLNKRTSLLEPQDKTHLYMGLWL